jgi:hypothetical protein
VSLRAYQGTNAGRVTGLGGGWRCRG